MDYFSMHLGLIMLFSTEQHNKFFCPNKPIEHIVALFCVVSWAARALSTALLVF